MIYTLIILAVLTVLMGIALCNVSGRESDRELIEWCRKMEEDDEKGDDYGNAERVQESKTYRNDGVGAAGVG